MRQFVTVFAAICAAGTAGVFVGFKTMQVIWKDGR